MGWRKRDKGEKAVKQHWPESLMKPGGYGATLPSSALTTPPPSFGAGYKPTPEEQAALEAQAAKFAAEAQSAKDQPG